MVVQCFCNLLVSGSDSIYNQQLVRLKQLIKETETSAKFNQVKPRFDKLN